MTRSAEDRIPTIAVEDLLADLKGLPEGTRIGFSGLTFYRPKWRGQTTLNIEFNEHVYRDSNGRVVIEALGPGR